MARTINDFTVETEQCQAKLSQLKFFNQKSPNRAAVLMDKSEKRKTTEKKDTLLLKNQINLRVNRTQKRRSSVKALLSPTDVNQGVDKNCCSPVLFEEECTSTTTSTDEYEIKNNGNLKTSTKFPKRRPLAQKNNTTEKHQIRKSRRRGNNLFQSLSETLLSNSTSSSSLASIVSSTSSGFDTGDSRKESSRVVVRELLSKEVEVAAEKFSQDTPAMKREDSALSISMSSTPLSTEYGDDESQESGIRYTDSNESVRGSSSSSDRESEQNDQINFQFSHSNEIETTDFKTCNIDNSSDIKSENKNYTQTNNHINFIPFLYHPLFVINLPNDINLTNYYTHTKYQHYDEITPLLDNPKVERFYHDQRQFYRQMYDQQFAACGSALFESTSVSNIHCCIEASHGFVPTFSVDNGASLNKENFAIWGQNCQSRSDKRENFRQKNSRKYFSKTQRPTQFYYDHQHLGYPICLPVAAMNYWQTLGLNYIPHNNQWHLLDENKMPIHSIHANILPFTTCFLYTSENIFMQPDPPYMQSDNQSIANDGTLKQHDSIKDKNLNNPFPENNTDFCIPINDERTNNERDQNSVTLQPEQSNETYQDPAQNMADYRTRAFYVGNNNNGTVSNGNSGSSGLNEGNIRYEVSRMDVLSDQIIDFHQSVEQTQSTLSRKLNLRDMLYHTIAPIFPMCGLYIVGSSLNGFGNNKSDMDLCLMITNRDIDQRSDAVIVLQSIMRTLQTTKFVADQQLILAKVPILRIKFHSTFSDITVDLNANNSVAIRNTHLLCYYSSFDWRVRPLVSVVKEWAKRRGINDANRSSFTSYSLVLMVIHYLQCGADPPVLPSLQQLYSKRFNQKADVRQLNVSLPLDPPPSTLWDFSDRLTLSELLIGFFQYYAFNFNFDVDAISIRMGRKTERAFVARNRSPYNHLSQWHCICIEEPFTLSNTAHSIYDERIFDSIKKAFIDGFQNLDTNRDLQLFLG